MNKEEQIIESISNFLGIDHKKINKFCNLTSDLGLKENKKADLIWQIEAEYGKNIRKSTSSSFQTIGDLIEYIEKY